MPKLTPNYLSVDAQGRVTANFSGGILMPAGSGIITPVPGGSVRWEDTGHGLVAFLQAARDATQSAVTMEADSVNPVRYAKLNVIAGEGILDDANVSVKAQSSASVASATILTSIGRSSFLQYGGITAKRSAYRAMTFSWPGGQSMANNITLASLGLGFTPSYGFAAPADGNAQNFVAFPMYIGWAAAVTAVAQQSNLGGLGGFVPVNPGAGSLNSCAMLFVE